MAYRPLAPRAVRDQQLADEITRIWRASYQVYVAYKMWRELNRQGNVAALSLAALPRPGGVRFACA